MWRLVHNANRVFRQNFACIQACPPAQSQAGNASEEEKAKTHFYDKRLQAYVGRKKNEGEIPIVGCFKSLEVLSVGVALALSLNWHKVKHEDFQHFKLYLKNYLYAPSLQTTSSVLPQSTVKSKPQITDEKIQSDLDTALQQFAEASNQYVGSIQNSYGLQYAETDHKLAFHYFKSASELGCPKACYNLALCYERGFGTKQDFTKATECYQQAANLGHVAAIYNLAIYYAQGKGEIKKDLDKAKNYFQLAADKGIKEAQTYIGVHYLQDGNWSEALKLLQNAADQQDHHAEFYLGVCYDFGWATNANPVQAAHYYAKAANAGHSGALYNLAVFYENGLGGLRMDPFYAIELYKKVANENSDAAYNLKRLKSLYTQKHSDENDALFGEYNLDLYPNSSHTSSLLQNSVNWTIPSSSSAPILAVNQGDKHQKMTPWSAFLNLILPSTHSLVPSHSNNETNTYDLDSALGSSLNSSVSCSPSSTTFKQEFSSPELSPTLCENNSKTSRFDFPDLTLPSSESSYSSPRFFIDGDSNDDESSSDSGYLGIFRYEECGPSSQRIMI